MASKKRRSNQDLDSLIPALKSEEKHLEDLLADARARGEAMVQAAEARAAARVQAARQALPGILQAEHESRRAALESSAAEAARAETEKTGELERRARAAMEPTVKYIVALVWPGARQDPPGAAPNPPGAAPNPPGAAPNPPGAAR